MGAGGRRAAARKRQAAGDPYAAFLKYVHNWDGAGTTSDNGVTTTLVGSPVVSGGEIILGANKYATATISGGLGSGDFVLETFTTSTTTTNGSSGNVLLGSAWFSSGGWFLTYDHSGNPGKISWLDANASGGGFTLVSDAVTMHGQGSVHTAIVRSGGTLGIYLQGNRVGQIASSSNLSRPEFHTGAFGPPTNAQLGAFNGSNQAVRLTVGSDRGLGTGATIPVPTLPFLGA